MCPVRPSDSDLLCQPCDGDEDGYESIGKAPIEAHTDHAEKLREEDIVDLDEDVFIQPAQPLPQPKVPTAAQIAAHNITHLPYRSWCPHCVAARRPNSHHRSSSSESQRDAPLLAADYCFVRDSNDDECGTVLVAHLYPSRAMMATVVDSKRPETNEVSRLAKFLRDSGYAEVIYKSDQEDSI